MIDVHSGRAGEIGIHFFNVRKKLKKLVRIVLGYDNDSGKEVVN